MVYRTPAETRTPSSEEDRAFAGKRAVGIDLGGANSVICAIDFGEPEVVLNAEGARTTPSVVAFTESGEVLVGEAARRQAVTNPDRTVQSFVRHLGTDWRFTIGGREFGAPEIASFVLRKLKQDAEARLGQEITEAVVCVPAGANYDVILATREAARLAGLQPLIVAPNEWLIALGHGRWEDEDLIMMVLDLGATSFGVSVIEVGDGVVEVKAVGGDSRLGGDDWDQVLVDHLVERFRSHHGVDLTQDRMALRRLREAAERAKIELSFSTETSIDLPYLVVSPEGQLHLEEKVTRAWFQERTADLLARCDSAIQQVLRDVGIRLSGLGHVVLVGGSTRMPAVAEFVRKLTGMEANRGVNPDEIVAIGAALRVGVLKGEVKGVLLLDAAPLSLGFETKGGIMTKLIERNTTIPTKRSEVFTTTEDDQVYAQIPVYQGEREIAAYNRMLGLVELTGLPRAARGVPQIEVSFDIDGWGMLSVTAKALPDGEAQSAFVGDTDSWSTSPRRPDALLAYALPPGAEDAKPHDPYGAAQEAQARDSQGPAGQGGSSSSENTTRNKRWWSR
ncbi:Hsp70 family protein [Streptomyces liliifuscus]|uniref:Hsp70 family protein n=1 Tax=Streptomyces liliifuscus TaxID=2797636 RepID=A0A7T7L5L6_9ACTN|nr:Hsp70 family protein [Streptomyces liliifuscus]